MVSAHLKWLVSTKSSMNKLVSIGDKEQYMKKINLTKALKNKKTHLFNLDISVFGGEGIATTLLWLKFWHILLAGIRATGCEIRLHLLQCEFEPMGSCLLCL